MKKNHPSAAKPRKKKRCGAKTRAKGKCRKWGMLNGRCRLHGGATPHGWALPQTKTGKHSKYLRTDADLLERYDRGVNDPDLLALTDEIALIDSRVMTLLAEGGEVELQAVWGEMVSLKNEMEKYRLSKNNAGMAYIMSEILARIDLGSETVKKYAEISRHFEQRRRLVETERKRQIAMKIWATADEQMSLVMQVATLVRDNVNDPKELQAISAGLADIITARVSQSATAE